MTKQILKLARWDKFEPTKLNESSIDVFDLYAIW